MEMRAMVENPKAHLSVLISNPILVGEDGYRKASPPQSPRIRWMEYTLYKHFILSYFVLLPSLTYIYFKYKSEQIFCDIYPINPYEWIRSEVQTGTNF